MVAIVSKQAISFFFLQEGEVPLYIAQDFLLGLRDGLEAYLGQIGHWFVFVTGIDMVIKNLDLEPKIDAMMRDFLIGIIGKLLLGAAVLFPCFHQSIGSSESTGFKENPLMVLCWLLVPLVRRLHEHSVLPPFTVCGVFVVGYSARGQEGCGWGGSVTGEGGRTWLGGFLVVRKFQADDTIFSGGEGRDGRMGDQICSSWIGIVLRELEVRGAATALRNIVVATGVIGVGMGAISLFLGLCLYGMMRGWGN
ncbi:hypothetical protein Tco_1244462 [Tanacetum coccineum]